MKKKLKQELQQFFAIIILLVCIGAWVLLTGAMLVDLIKPVPYLLWMLGVGIVLFIDGGWISKHFVGGDWI